MSCGRWIRVLELSTHPNSSCLLAFIFSLAYPMANLELETGGDVAFFHLQISLSLFSNIFLLL
jgi:hypothetical protein